MNQWNEEEFRAELRRLKRRHRRMSVVLNVLFVGTAVFAAVVIVLALM